MNKFLIVIIFIITVVISNTQHTKELKELNKLHLSQLENVKNKETNKLNKLNTLYTSQTSEIKDKSLQTINELKNKSSKQIKKLEDKSTSALQKLENNINTQAKKLKISQNKLSKVLNNIKIYEKKRIDNFINNRKKDIIFLSRITLRQKLITSFYHANKLNKQNIYKEIVFFNLKGKEIYKKSKIEVLKMDISKKKNTYCQKEIYFNNINDIQEGQVYISKTISCKNNKPMIRMITPIIRKFKKVGFLSVALDLQHIEKIKKDLKNIKG